MSARRWNRPLSGHLNTKSQLIRSYSIRIRISITTNWECQTSKSTCMLHILVPRDALGHHAELLQEWREVESQLFIAQLANDLAELLQLQRQRSLQSSP